MGKYRVVAGQNIYDVALYLYGSIVDIHGGYDYF